MPYYCPGACNQLVGRGHGTIGLKLLGATALVETRVWPTWARSSGPAIWYEFLFGSKPQAASDKGKIIFDNISFVWDKMI